MSRALLLSILLSSLPAVLASCGGDEYSDQYSAVEGEVGLLSADIQVSVAQHTLVLPFIAMHDYAYYAYRKPSFPLDRKGDGERPERPLSALNDFLYGSADPKKPLVLDSLSVVVRTYGSNDSDGHPRRVCPLLTREWAQSVCDNSQAALRQAPPANHFRLVDLRRLQIGDPRAECRDDGKPRRPLPQRTGEAAMVCTARVFGGREDQYHHAVVRIDGHLGALWTVWGYGQNGETAEAMTEREGKAIVAFVRYALGKSEDFRKLHSAMCHLRRPGTVVGPQGACA